MRKAQGKGVACDELCSAKARSHQAPSTWAEGDLQGVNREVTLWEESRGGDTVQNIGILTMKRVYPEL